MFADTSPSDPSLPSHGRFERLVRAIAEARMRMYLRSVIDPATGVVNPDLERSVLRTMAV